MRDDGPVLDDAALYGLAGEIVRTLEPHTEADPAALLVSMLTMFGSAAAPEPHAVADAADHPPRLFVVLVGRSARSRKGSAVKNVERLMRVADPEWVSSSLVGGLASGEGLIAHAAQHEGQGLVCVEEEFARALTAGGRSGSTLSPVIRQAWDGCVLRTMTKDPITASNAHVSIIGNITIDELRVRVREEISNGFANRFMYICVQRAKLLPDGGKPQGDELEGLGARLREALEFARNVGEVTRSPAASEQWASIYCELADDDPPGLLGEATARAEAQVLRLAVAYALLDRSDRIEVVHQEAALAVWQYARASAEMIFPASIGDSLAVRVYDAICTAGPEGIDRTGLHGALGGHVPAQQLQPRLELLQTRGLISLDRISTGGRPRELIRATPPPIEAKEPKKPGDDGPAR
jgi:hypothetical protein